METQNNQQTQRLRMTVKQLAIELGYLERCLDEGLHDQEIYAASMQLDGVIDHLNAYLAGTQSGRKAA